MGDIFSSQDILKFSFHFIHHTLTRCQMMSSLVASWFTTDPRYLNVLHLLRTTKFNSLVTNNIKKFFHCSPYLTRKTEVWMGRTKVWKSNKERAHIIIPSLFSFILQKQFSFDDGQNDHTVLLYTFVHSYTFLYVYWYSRSSNTQYAYSKSLYWVYVCSYAYSIK